MGEPDLNSNPHWLQAASRSHFFVSAVCCSWRYEIQSALNFQTGSKASRTAWPSSWGSSCVQPANKDARKCRGSSVLGARGKVKETWTGTISREWTHKQTGGNTVLWKKECCGWCVVGGGWGRGRGQTCRKNMPQLVLYHLDTRNWSYLKGGNLMPP